MKVKERKNVQKGLKLYTFLEQGRLSDFEKWLTKQAQAPVGIGINEGCGTYKCPVLSKAASMPEVKWEDIVILIDRFKADVMKKDVNRWTLLHWAAYGNNNVIIRKLLYRYDQVKQIINNQTSARQPGDTALMVAAVNRHYDAFHQLLDGGADPLIENNLGKTVLDVLQDQGRRVDMQRVIQASIQPDRVCLVEAATRSNWALVRRVLSELNQGDTIDQRGQTGETLLHVVVCEGQSDLVTMLLQRNVDPNIGDNKGYTPIFGTVDNTSSHTCAELLLRHNADVTLLDKNNCTLFHHIAYEGRVDILEAVKENVPLQIIHSVINLPCGSRTLYSPLLTKRVTLEGTAIQIAALVGNDECLTALIDVGGDLYGFDVKGRNIIEIIHDAKGSDTSRNSTELDKMLFILYKLDPTWQQARRLIEVQYNADYRLNDGKTILHILSKSSESPQIVELFLNNLANPNLLDDAQNSPLYYAVTSDSRRSNEIVQLLLNYDACVLYTDESGSDRNMFITALLHSNDTAAQLMYDEHRVSLNNNIETNKLTLLQFITIILNGNTTVLRFLQEDVQLSYFDKMLHSTDQVAVSQIIQHCQVDTTGFRRQALFYIDLTLLHAAALCCDVSMVKYLLSIGAQASRCNTKGQTATDLMMRYHNTSDPQVRSVLSILDEEDDDRNSLKDGTKFEGHKVNQRHAAIITTSRDQEYTARDFPDNKHDLGFDSSSLPKVLPYNVKRQQQFTAEGHHADLVRYLTLSWCDIKTTLEDGFNPNATDNNGYTLLHHFTAQAKSTKIIELLLQFSSNPNLQTHTGYTPLSLAIASPGPKKREIVSLLLEYGAQLITTSQSRDQSADVRHVHPIQMALQQRQTSLDVVKILFEYFPDQIQKELEENKLTVEYFQNRVLANDKDILIFLHERVKLTYLKKYLETTKPYDIPASLQQDVPLSSLLESHNDVSMTNTTVAFVADVLSAGSCVHIASLACNVLMLKCLITCGVNVNAKDVCDRTAFQLIQDCYVFFKDEFRPKLFQVCRLLGSSPAYLMSSMASLTDSVIDVRSRYHQSRVPYTDKKQAHNHNHDHILQLKSEINIVLENRFKEIEKLVDASQSATSNSRLKQLSDATRRDVNALLDPFLARNKSVAAHDVKRKTFSTHPELMGASLSFDDGGSVYGTSRDSLGSYRIVPYQNSSTPRNRQPNRSDVNTTTVGVVSAAKSTGSASAADDVTRDDVSFSESDSASLASSDELFGHIAKRLLDQGCQWEYLVEKLAVSQSCKKQIKRDIHAKQALKRRSSLENICDALTLWKTYSGEAPSGGRKLKRAFVDLGMKDLADDLTTDLEFRGYEQN